MPPRKAKQDASNSARNSTACSTTPQDQIQIDIVNEIRTPKRNSTTMATGLAPAQKQALMDNLQLEITERARKLRAQYALQAQDLRSRLERRVSRIPPALRNKKMQDLIDEHASKDGAKQVAAIPLEPSSVYLVEGGPNRGTKRPSDQISTGEGKENTVSSPFQDLASPKKRAKTTANDAGTARPAVQKNVASAVLSPKSHNSRALPRSPFKSATAHSSVQPAARTASPTKPHPPPKAPTRAQARQTKRTPATTSDQENEGRSSEGSSTSAGTTIVSKLAAKVRTAGKRAAATKTTASVAAKKAATAPKKKEAAPPAPTAAGGRTLRKRT